MPTLDQLGNDAYNEDWANACGPDVNASDGVRVTSAKALQIAADTLRLHLDPPTDRGWVWTDNDILLALGAIAGIRAQRGCKEVTEDDVEFLTELMDIAIYG